MAGRDDSAAGAPEQPREMTHPRTKVVLQSCQFSASSSTQIAPRTKVVLATSQPPPPQVTLRTTVVLQSHQFEGDTLTQTNPITDLDQIYDAFQTEWMARWDRHANAVDSRWEPIVDFVGIAIPTNAIQFDRVCHLATCCRQEKGQGRHPIKSDGVSKDDIFALS